MSTSAEPKIIDRRHSAQPDDGARRKRRERIKEQSRQRSVLQATYDLLKAEWNACDPAIAEAKVQRAARVELLDAELETDITPERCRQIVQELADAERECAESCQRLSNMKAQLEPRLRKLIQTITGLHTEDDLTRADAARPDLHYRLVALQQRARRERDSIRVAERQVQSFESAKAVADGGARVNAWGDVLDDSFQVNERALQQARATLQALREALADTEREIRALIDEIKAE